MKEVVEKRNAIKKFFNTNARRIYEAKPSLKDLKENEELFFLFDYGKKMIKTKSEAAYFRKNNDLTGKAFYALPKNLVNKIP